MSCLALYKDVWVITISDPAADIEMEDTVIGVFESKEAADKRYDELMKDNEKDKHAKLFIEQSAMHLGVKAFEVMT